MASVEPPQTTRTMGRPILRRVELRLAMVFYGGVSLAVYSFGHTFEVFMLWKASQAFDRAMARADEVGWCEACKAERPHEGTPQVYFDLLTSFKEQNQVHLTVKVDVLGGTSAGGINAVILAKALMNPTCNLRDLMKFWLNVADMNKLEFSGKQVLNSTLPNSWTSLRQILTPIVGVSASILAAIVSPVLIGKIKKEFGDVIPLPARHVSYGVLALLESFPLFDGRFMHRNLAVGLSEIGAVSVGKTREERKNKLTLFTTFTSLRPFRHIVTKEQQYTIVLRFRKEDFLTDPNIDRKLAFAARATSAFPLAFAGTSIQEGASISLKDINGREIPRAATYEFLERQLRRYSVDYDGQLPAGFEARECADGGILLNKPFKPVVEELNERRMTVGNNVQRRILFLDPQPAPSIATAEPNPALTPSLFTTLDEERFGPLLKELQNRFHVKRTKALQPDFVREDSNQYDWLSHGRKVGYALFGQPIEDEIRRIAEFNQQLKRVNDFSLNAFRRAKFLANQTFTQESAQNNELVQSFWMCTTPVQLPLPRNRLYQAAFMLSAPHEQIAYLSARYEEFIRSTGSILAGPNYLDFPDCSEKRRCLVEERTIELFRTPHEVADLPLDVFERLVENDLFFLRDLLYHVVRVLENPLLVMDPQTLTSDLSPFIRELSLLIQDHIHEIDYVLDTPPEGWSPDKTRWTEWGPDDIEGLRAAWIDTFSRILDSVMQGVESALRRAQSIPLRQLVYRPIFLFSFFDVTSFAFTTATGPIGDNAVTKTVRLSPDSTDADFTKPVPALFREAREIVRREGLIGFSDVFLRSTDFIWFGGFLEQKYREFDIVWSRMDATEQLCRVLADAVTDDMKREKREAKIVHGVDRISRNAVSDHVLADFSLRAAQIVIGEELPNTRTSAAIPVLSHSDNIHFFRGMLETLEQRHQPQTG